MNFPSSLFFPCFLKPILDCIKIINYKLAFRHGILMSIIERSFFAKKSALLQNALVSSFCIQLQFFFKSLHLLKRTRKRCVNGIDMMSNILKHRTIFLVFCKVIPRLLCYTIFFHIF